MPKESTDQLPARCTSEARKMLPGPEVEIDTAALLPPGISAARQVFIGRESSILTIGEIRTHLPHFTLPFRMSVGAGKTDLDLVKLRNMTMYPSGGQCLASTRMWVVERHTLFWASTIRLIHALTVDSVLVAHTGAYHKATTSRSKLGGSSRSSPMSKSFGPSSVLAIGF